MVSEEVRHEVLTPPELYEDGLDAYQILYRSGRGDRLTEIVTVPGVFDGVHPSEEDLSAQEGVSIDSLYYNQSGELVMIDRKYNSPEGVRRTRIIMRNIPFVDADRQGCDAVLMYEYELADGEWKLSQPVNHSPVTLVIPDIIAEEGRDEKGFPVRRRGYTRPAMMPSTGEYGLLDGEPQARMSYEISCDIMQDPDMSANFRAVPRTRPQDQVAIDIHGNMHRPSEDSVGYSPLEVKQDTDGMVMLTRDLQLIRQSPLEKPREGWKIGALTIPKVLPQSTSHIMESLQ